MNKYKTYEDTRIQHLDKHLFTLQSYTQSNQEKYQSMVGQIGDLKTLTDLFACTNQILRNTKGYIYFLLIRPMASRITKLTA